MGMVYQYRVEGLYTVPAQIVGEALETIGGHNSGEITPEQVVDAARPVSHPLHPVFEWDDTVAAERWRKAQAGDLLRCVVATMPERPTSTPTRAFVSIRAAEGQAYVPIRTAMSDPDLRQQVLANAMRELVSWRKRHKELQELADLFTQIDLFADEHLSDDNPEAG